jgi:hypothetical protein
MAVMTCLAAALLQCVRNDGLALADTPGVVASGVGVLVAAKIVRKLQSDRRHDAK